VPPVATAAPEPPEDPDNLPALHRTHGGHENLLTSLDTMMNVSKAIANSKMYKGESSDSALVKLLLAHELGFGMTSLSSIHVFDGKVQVGYQILSALVKRSGKYDYRILERTADICRIKWFENGEDVGDSEFTIEEAQRAGLLSKSNWKNYPKRMLTARAIADGFNTYTTELSGGAIYVDGELDDDDDGYRPAAFVDTRQVPEPAPAPAVVEPEEEIRDAEVVPHEEPADPSPEGVAMNETMVDEDARQKAAEAAKVPAQVAHEKTRADDQEESISKVRQMTLIGVPVEEKGDLRACMETLGIWTKEGPKELWHMFGQKAYTWEALKEPLHEAAKREFARLEAIAEAERAEAVADNPPDPAEPPFGEDAA
jgi:hypothetical protein